MKRKLKLKRPLAFFDLETTGKYPDTARIVEIGIIKLFPDGKEDRFHSLVNPGIPIPLGATLVHGISDEDVKRKPRFEKIAAKVEKFLRNCDLGGFGVVKFDVPFLQSEFSRAGVAFSLNDRRIVDALKIFHLKERRDLAAAYLFYCGKEHADAHSAIHDARVSYSRWPIRQICLLLRELGARFPNSRPQ